MYWRTLSIPRQCLNLKAERELLPYGFGGGRRRTSFPSRRSEEGRERFRGLDNAEKSAAYIRIGGRHVVQSSSRPPRSVWEANVAGTGFNLNAGELASSTG